MMTMTEIHVVLISCTKAKFNELMPAKDLYAASAWFRSAWAYARSRATNPMFDIYILSAKHGLVNPTRPLEPYDYQMPTRIVPRLNWAIKVRTALRCIYADRKVCFWLIAGKHYRDPLAGLLNEAEEWRTMEPMARIPGIQAQRDWLSAAKGRLMEDEQARLFGRSVSV